TRSDRDWSSDVCSSDLPAQTVFEVKFYWALFRLDEARLGSDTVVGLGGRDPALLPPAVLGESYLAEAQLVAGHPFNVRERQVIEIGRASCRARVGRAVG